MRDGVLELSLRVPDFTTASRIAQSVNQSFRGFLAEPSNPGRVPVKLPLWARDNPSFSPIAFISQLEQLEVVPDDRARVVVNERTGTIVAGGEVGLAPVAISHGFLQVLVEKSQSHIAQTQGGPTVSDLAKALNAMGAGPRDLVSILQSLREANALQGELRFL